MPNATTPSSIEALATPMTRPFGRASWCSVTSPPVGRAARVHRHRPAGRRGLGEHQDNEKRGREGQAEEGREEQRRPPELGPLAGKCSPHHLIAPISWPAGTSAEAVPVSAKNARSTLRGLSASWRRATPPLAASPF